MPGELALSTGSATTADIMAEVKRPKSNLIEKVRKRMESDRARDKI